MANWKEKLKNRTLSTTTHRNESGFTRKSVLNLDQIGLPIWTPKCGVGVKNRIDIMPWKVTQDWYSKIFSKNGQCYGLEPGDYDYKLELPLHYNVGSNNDVFLCLKAAFGQTDAICEARSAEYEKQANGDSSFNEDKAKSLWTSFVDYYVIFDYDNPDQGYQLFKSSFNNFETYLLEAMAVFVSGDGEIVPWHPDEGYMLVFGCKEKSFQKNKYAEVNGDIEFVKRTEVISDEDLESIPSLDAAVNIPTADEIRDTFLGTVEEIKSNKTPEENKPVSRTSRRVVKKVEEPKEDQMPEWDAITMCQFGYKFGEDCCTKKECNEECDDKTYEACEELKHELDEKVQEESSPKQIEEPVEEKSTRNVSRRRR